MAAPNSRRPSTHIRSFGIPEPLSEDSNEAAGPSTARRILAWMSFSSLRPGRPSFLHRRSEEEAPSTPSTERAPIPTMSASGEVYMTPLPKLSMIVLSIVRIKFIFSAFHLSIFSTRFGDIDNARRIFVSKCFDTISSVHGQGWVIYHQHTASSLTLAGFGEFKDDAEVAFWTGILGTLVDHSTKRPC